MRTLSRPPTAAAPRIVEGADPGRGDGEPAAGTRRRLIEACSQIVVDQGADRRQHQIGAALEAAHAMVLHRLMAGAF
jgi:hypothetical protein